MERRCKEGERRKYQSQCILPELRQDAPMPSASGHSLWVSLDYGVGGGMAQRQLNTKSHMIVVQRAG